MWVTDASGTEERVDLSTCLGVLEGQIIVQSGSQTTRFDADRTLGPLAVWTPYEFNLAQQRALIGRELASQGLLPAEGAAQYVATADFGRLVGEVRHAAAR